MCWSEFWDDCAVLLQRWCMCQPHVSLMNSVNMLVILRILCFSESFLGKPTFSGLVRFLKSSWRKLFFKSRRAQCLQHRGQKNLVMRAKETYVQILPIRHRRRRQRNKPRKLSMGSFGLGEVLVGLGFETPVCFHQHAHHSSQDGVAS